MKPASQFVLAVAAALGLSLLACSDSSGENLGAGDQDAGVIDAGVVDGRVTDAGTSDAGVAGAVDVHGKVISRAGQPSGSVLVLIKSGGFSARTLTDSSGAFTVRNVPTPYDATVVVPPSEATITLGLTSATPTVLDFRAQAPRGGGSGSLNGTVTGGTGYPAPEGYLTSVVFASPEIQTDRYVIADQETGAYTTDRFDDSYGPPVRIPLRWSGPGTTVGTVHALQWKQADPGAFSGAYTLRIPASYSGYGSRVDVSLADGSVLTGQDIALIPVDAGTFSGSYTPPTGYSVDSTLAALRFARGGLMVIVADYPLDEEFRYLTPNIPGATLSLATTGSKGTAFSTAYEPGLAVNATGLAVSSPAASELSVPPDNAVGIGVGTQFGWTPVPNGVHLLVIGSPDSSSPSYAILTSGTSATLPDLSSDGVPLPGPTAYQWSVYGIGPYASVEAASAGLTAEHPWPLFTLGDFLLDARTRGFVTGSSTRVFITPSPWDYLRAAR